MIKRTTIAALSLSAAALVGIALTEDYRDEAHIPVPGDVPTVGFGHTGPEVRLGTTTTPPRALKQLLADSSEAERAVRRCAPVPMYQREFDAYVSLTVNIGAGAFCRSAAARNLRAGAYDAACAEILRWDRFRGQPLRGLTKRRQAEYALCMGTKQAAAPQTTVDR